MGPAEHEEGGSLWVQRQRDAPGRGVAMPFRHIQAWRPAVAACHASKRAGRAVRRGTTYRPRSVSSLLMRLRAMSVCVCLFLYVCSGCVGGFVESVVCRWRKSWRGCLRTGPALALDPKESKCGGVSAEGVPATPNVPVTASRWAAVAATSSEVVGKEEGAGSMGLSRPADCIYHASKRRTGRDKPRQSPQNYSPTLPVTFPQTQQRRPGGDRWNHAERTIARLTFTPTSASPIRCQVLLCSSAFLPSRRSLIVDPACTTHAAISCETLDVHIACSAFVPASLSYIHSPACAGATAELQVGHDWLSAFSTLLGRTATTSLGRHLPSSIFHLPFLSPHVAR
jgi:hypothetical protein